MKTAVPDVADVTYLPLGTFMFRAPLLPVGHGTPDRLLADPLGRRALELASPALVAGLTRENRGPGLEAPGKLTGRVAGVAPTHKGRAKPDSPAQSAPPSAAARALARYAARAAFRPTPHGLWAGVGIGSLGRHTAVRTGAPRAHGHLSWTGIRALGRSLLAQPQVRAASRVRLGPSVIAAGESVQWLGPARDQGFLEEARSAIDEVVRAVLDGAAGWTDWPVLRRHVMAAVADETAARASGPADDSYKHEDEDQDDDSALADSIDDLLLTMLDDGLLDCDLLPPLIGPLPATWMIERLSRLTLDPGSPGPPPLEPEIASEIAAALLEGPDSLVEQLAASSADAAAGRLAEAAARLAAWSSRWADATGWAHAGAAGPPRDADDARFDPTRIGGIEAVLRFDSPPCEVVAARSVIERAAGLAPLLFRLQEALTPPLLERVPGPALADALAAVTECFGEGALDLAELAGGMYGVTAGPARHPEGGQEEGQEEGRQEGGQDDDGSDRGIDDGLLGDSFSPRLGGAPPPALLTLLVNALVESRAAGGGPKTSEIRLSSASLDAALPEMRAPPTCELFLTPTGGPAGGRAAPGATAAGGAPDSTSPGAPADGDGWLLGLHAPAGASWGRFGHALRPEESARLFPPLVAAEREARPGEEAADVAFCPHPSLGDLCAHPSFRPHALALTHWPSEGGAGGAVRVSSVGTLELCADSAAPEPLALRRHDGGPLAPSAMHRVRSTTAPPGLWRLLAGWRLCRQHRPWAMSPGPLAALDRWPRVRLDGFVIAPASWRIPASLAQPRAPAAKRDPTSNVTRKAATDGDGTGEGFGEGFGEAAVQELALWRERDAVPRFVQLGREDELLPLDLASPHAHTELLGHDRVFEIWPPLGDTPDETGRRIELVVALVDRPNAEVRALVQREVDRVTATGPVLPPHRRGGLDDGAGWTTFKLFGVAEAQDGLLLDVVGRAVESAREARGREAGGGPEIDRWFFQRYVDPPGQRAHLRVRVHGRLRVPARARGPSTASAAAEAAATAASTFAARLELHLAEAGARARGAVVSLETSPYFPEAARYGGPEALPFVHALFEADSDFVLGCLAEEAGDDAGEADTELAGLLEAEQVTDIRVTRILALVTGLEALALGLGFDLESRRALAARRRQALLRAFFAPRDGEPATTARAGWPKAFRTLKPALRARLPSVALAFATATRSPASRPAPPRRAGSSSSSKVQPADAAAPPPSRGLLAYARAIARLGGHDATIARTAVDRILPALLHVNAVRMLGADRVGELQAYTFWERTLESLARHPATPAAKRR